MPFRFTPRLRIAAALLAVVSLLALVATFAPQLATRTAHAASRNIPLCTVDAEFCTETIDPYNYAGQYSGHDEPSLLFYSNTAGAGNSNLYQLTLPSDPPTAPNQNGTGGTFNFQLHPTFWFGMAICNDQSAPNPGGSSVGPVVPCTPDSDSNIYNSSDPASPRYIGHHPGTSFMEMQIYPPGWAPFATGGTSCDATHWCAALVIWSLAQNENTGQALNNRCTSKIGGTEYPNFAFITKNGVS